MVLQVLQVQAFVACWGSQRVVVEAVYSVSERENINPFCSLGINKILHHRPPLQAHSGQPISASAHPKQSINQKHTTLLAPQD